MRGSIFHRHYGYRPGVGPGRGEGKLLPFSDDFSADKPGWIGDTWSVADGVVKNTPTLGADIALNGTFDTTAFWVAQSGWSISDGKARASNPASNIDCVSVAGVVGQWYRMACDVERTAGILVPTIGGAGKSITTAGAHVFTGRAINTHSLRAYGSETFVGTLDNVVCQPITLASLFLLRDCGTPNVTVEVDLTLLTSTQAGIALCADDPTTPASFIIAYLTATSGTNNLKVDQCVGGTYTNLITATVSYSAGGTLRLSLLDGDLVVAYQDLEAGTAEITDETLLGATHHGLFSTHEDNTFDNLSIIASDGGTPPGPFRVELFIDERDIASLDGLTRSINRPAKAAGNPIFEAPPNVATWDYGKVYVDVLRLADGDYRMWYTAAEDSPDWVRRLAYATSEDGLTWTKPSLGLVAFGGDTDNNILVDHVCNNVAVDYEAGRDPAFVACIESPPGSTGGIYLYGSADGLTWTPLKTIVELAAFPWSSHIEGKEIARDDAGRYLVYLTLDHDLQRRKVGVYRSLTDDPAGEWAYLGVCINTTDQDAQKYTLGIERVGAVWYGFVMDYNKSTEQIHVDLYASRDGLNGWTLLSDQWIPLGADGAFDDEMIFAGKSLVRVGDNWHFYYCGFLDNHAGGQPRDAQVGVAIIGYRRIGQVAGTGTLVTAPLRPDAGAALTVNADASGGMLLVEVLDADGNVLDGYAAADCTPVTTDTVEATVTWGEQGLPAGQEIALKFYLTDATLYAYEVGT